MYSVLFLDFDGVINSWESSQFIGRKDRKRKIRNSLGKMVWGAGERLFSLFNVSRKSKVYRLFTFLHSLLVSSYYEMDCYSCSNIQELLAWNPDLKIVISSTWRVLYPLYQLKFVLWMNGIDHKRVIGITTTGHDCECYCEGLCSANRGHQIEAWLKANPAVTNFIIVDDDSDMGKLSNRLVRTSTDFGFTLDNLKQADSMLNGGVARWARL